MLLNRLRYAIKQCQVTLVLKFLVRLSNKSVGLALAPLSEKVENHWSKAVVFNIGVTTHIGIVCFFPRGRESFWWKLITSIISISYREPLFVVAEIIGSPGKNDV